LIIITLTLQNFDQLQSEETMPSSNAEASSSKRQNKPYSKGNNAKHKKGQQPPKRNPDSGKLGVSKIKSMIRQATRLLQKEGIEPGLKVQTERRLESLKADLRTAELGNVEKKNHERYHMVSQYHDSMAEANMLTLLYHCRSDSLVRSDLPCRR
jgi:hypothetical protein